MPRHYLISYDICNEMRLRRVHAVVRGVSAPRGMVVTADSAASAS